VRYFGNGGDFADFLIVGQAETARCTALASFDKELQKRFPKFVVVPS
jgi:predicted nucleic-acid-binding protein